MPDRPGGVGSRREARERALALLYEAEAKGTGGDEVLDAQPIEVEEYAADVVAGVAVGAAAFVLAARATGNPLRRRQEPWTFRAVLDLSAYSEAEKVAERRG